MSFLLVTAFDDAYDVGFLCAASHEAYAQKHGYERLARGSAAGSASGSVNVESGWKTGRLERRSVCIARPLGSFRRRRELEIVAVGGLFLLSSRARAENGPRKGFGRRNKEVFFS